MIDLFIYLCNNEISSFSVYVETTKEFVSKLELKPGQKVLDVGCGIGGGDFYMAENFDVEVVGIDLSINMISFALERAIGRKCPVEFEVADCTKKTYPDNTFDVIYSRDTILHIQVRNIFMFLRHLVFLLIMLNWLTISQLSIFTTNEPHVRVQTHTHTNTRTHTHTNTRTHRYMNFIFLYAFIGNY